MPKISIITPVYIDIDPKAFWLNEMIQSVLSQTVTDWELILIDDKSPLPELVNGVRSQYNDARLRWLENGRNEGPARTRNTAVALAESDCILPLDSDDSLASDDVLEKMYEVWIQDKTKIIYGNLQQLVQVTPNSFKRGKLFNLGSYTFEAAMNLEGLMPVTAMHSVDCHRHTLYERSPGNWTYGWKHELDGGLEDLEYWIAAGEHGYCGQKIQLTTLLYRRQESSRAYEMKHVKQNFRAMQEKIKAMHAPIYRGEFPMACCGKGGSSPNAANPNPDPIVTSAQNSRAAKISALPGYKESELEWVAYFGPKGGSFDVMVRGPSALPSRYHILGTGHFFQVHKQQVQFFERMQHMGYRVRQQDPRQQPEPEPPPAIKQPAPAPQIIEQAKPDMSTLVRLDPVGFQTRQADVQPPKDRNEVIIEPNPPSSVSNAVIGMDSLRPDSASLDALGFGDKITDPLRRDQWTIDRLAGANVDDLITYDGIGKKRAQAIIDKAKDLLIVNQ